MFYQLSIFLEFHNYFSYARKLRNMLFSALMWGGKRIKNSFQKKMFQIKKENSLMHIIKIEKENVLYVVANNWIIKRVQISHGNGLKGLKEKLLAHQV